MATPAISQAREGRAITMGIISTSGGIGNTEDSTNATAASAGSAWRPSASRIVQS